MLFFILFYFSRSEHWQKLLLRKMLNESQPFRAGEKKKKRLEIFSQTFSARKNDHTVGRAEGAATFSSCSSPLKIPGISSFQKNL